MNIAFCINRLALTGLGATLSSLIRNCSDHSRLKVYFLCAGLTSRDKIRITKLLDSEGFTGLCRFLDFEPKYYFKAFRPLHGDWTAYGRLLLADFIDEDVVLYLDADLIVEADVLEVEDFNFSDTALAAVESGYFKNTLDKSFYIDRLGIPEDWRCFNSGVLLINLSEWRLQKVKDSCISIAEKYPNEFKSHDQSLLNALFAGKYSKLPSSFNCEWYADKPRPNAAGEKMILHFVGSPKPWDPLGSFIHNGYDTWVSYLPKGWKSVNSPLTPASIIRMWNIRRSYFRRIIKKLKNK